MTILPNQRVRSQLLSLWGYLRRRRKRQFLMLVLLMVASAFFEVVSLGLVVPFLGVLTAPERVFDNDVVASAAGLLGIETAEELRLPLVAAFAGVAVVTGVVRIFLLWVMHRLSYATANDLSSEVFRRTMYQPYQVHLEKNSSEVIAGQAKVGQLVSQVLLPVPRLISSAVLLIALVATLCVIDPLVTGIAFVGFGASYMLITWRFRRQLRYNSETQACEHIQVVKIQQEALGGIRDVILDGSHAMFTDTFRRSDARMRRAAGDNGFIAGAPKFAIEAVGLVLLVCLSYLLTLRDEGLVTALPILGALALGAQRILPAMQQIYDAWAKLNGSHAVTADTLRLLAQPLPDALERVEFDRLEFTDAFELRRVRFRYAASQPWVLEDIDLRIPKGMRCGIVGETGCGKSTLLDLIMGLLVPTEGELVVDGERLDRNRLRRWQRIVAHVPQEIYLADTSWSENIAFGQQQASIDQNRVRRSAEQAQISGLIEVRSGGYDQRVGERGVQISGGQRQRVGIARALYRQPGVLILDEATSALDSTTEANVMKAIDALDPDLTVLIVAHRLTTVEKCDLIVELDAGRIVARGTYEELMRDSASFRRLAHPSDGSDL